MLVPRTRLVFFTRKQCGGLLVRNRHLERLVQLVECVVQRRVKRPPCPHVGLKMRCSHTVWRHVFSQLVHFKTFSPRELTLNLVHLDRFQKHLPPLLETCAETCILLFSCELIYHELGNLDRSRWCQVRRFVDRVSSNRRVLYSTLEDTFCSKSAATKLIQCDSSTKL